MSRDGRNATRNYLRSDLNQGRHGYSGLYVVLVVDATAKPKLPLRMGNVHDSPALRVGNEICYLDL